MAPRTCGRECSELRHTSASSTRGASSGDSGLQRSSGKYPRLRPSTSSAEAAESSSAPRCMARLYTAERTRTLFSTVILPLVFNLDIPPSDTTVYTLITVTSLRACAQSEVTRKRHLSAIAPYEIGNRVTQLYSNKTPSASRLQMSPPL